MWDRRQSQPCDRTPTRVVRTTRDILEVPNLNSVVLPNSAKGFAKNKFDLL
ncbi:MAG: hypothetical protein SAK29_21240 [Scytonema sp. PMC 1069.18]|nr:hypothetical protein [Scytonema sp. PMC 1069.18]MEC4887080.1 hypothetical protein [Scytonema sp. PMC 1070.18]